MGWLPDGGVKLSGDKKELGCCCRVGFYTVPPLINPDQKTACRRACQSRLGLRIQNLASSTTPPISAEQSRAEQDDGRRLKSASQSGRMTETWAIIKTNRVWSQKDRGTALGRRRPLQSCQKCPAMTLQPLLLTGISGGSSVWARMIDKNLAPGISWRSV
jgi:hypothetical protein